jgi:hypothetical protein|tara:strand:+ start:531 stop:788 length:258 start_codon:yes stop_codon:yes gene_type:complete
MAETKTAPDDEKTPPQGVSLSLQDLVLMMNLIRATTERGAIRAEEMTEVGAVYNKLVQFLQESGAIQQSAEPQAETALTKEKKDD